MQTLSLIFEDKVLLVVDKPAGVIVNASDTTAREITLQDMVTSYLHLAPYSGEKVDSYNTTQVFHSRAGIVHRLDKETSGVILVAKNPEAFAALQKQFKERVVQKVYVALVHGEVIPKQGEIRAPIGRLPWNRMRFGVLAEGREALTTYEVMQTYIRGKETFSLLHLFPHTGRTHQLRVHTKYIQHPIVADELYAGRKVARNDRKALSRIFLHAFRITFQHPVTNQQVTYESPLPQELASYLGLLTPKS